MTSIVIRTGGSPLTDNFGVMKLLAAWRQRDKSKFTYLLFSHIILHNINGSKTDPFIQHLALDEKHSLCLDDSNTFDILPFICPICEESKDRNFLFFEKPCSSCYSFAAPILNSELMRALTEIMSS